jgi:DNA-directed RNA polymerase subunit alpha
VRSRNSLQKENIHTVKDLVQRSEQQMLAIDNFGKKSLQEISDFLAGHGLRFGQELDQSEDGTLMWVVRDLPGGDATETNRAGVDGTEQG